MSLVENNNTIEIFFKVTIEKTDKSNDTNIAEKNKFCPSLTPRLLLSFFQI